MRSLVILALVVPISLTASARREDARPPAAGERPQVVVVEAPARRTTAPASLRARPHLPGPLPAEVVGVVDGDTVEVRVTVWLGQEVTTRLRLRGIDAPELASDCAEERHLARAARDRLSELIDGEVLRVADIGLDKYGGRVVGRLLFASGEDVGAILAQEGFALTYDGGRREGWCGPRVTAGR